MIFPFCFLLMAIRIVQVDICRYILKWEIIDPDKASVEESKHALMEECPDDEPVCYDAKQSVPHIADEEKKS